MCDMEMPETNQPDLLKMIDENPTETVKGVEQKKEEKKSSFELPLDFIAVQEMQEIFDEDIVVHRQGSSEPESD